MYPAWPIRVACGLAVLLLTGCVANQPDQRNPSTHIEYADPHGNDDIHPDTPNAPTTLDDASRQTAIVVAETAMAAYASPQLEHDAWWAALSPTLTQRARQDYAYLQPSAITATTLAGPGQIIAEPSSYVVHVTVPTNVGAYELILTRADGASPWLVARFLTPEGVH